MRELTTAQINAINNASRVHDPAVYLGRYLEIMIDEYNAEIPKLLGASGTPVNAAAASATLTVNGVVVDGEKVLIGDDTYEFVADTAETVDPGNIAVNIKASTAAAHGTLTLDTQPISGNTVTIGTKVYIFVPVGTDTADGEVSIGADLAAAKVNLVAAINGTDGISEPHPLVRAANFIVNDCVITALIGGAAGNAIATTETFTAASNKFAAVTLLTGTDCSGANAITALVAAITAEDTEGVTAVEGIGDTIDLAAAVGAAGDSIEVSTTMARGSFGAGVTALSGGEDQTSPEGARFMVDGTNLYVYVVDTWYKIVLGSL